MLVVLKIKIKSRVLLVFQGFNQALFAFILGFPIPMDLPQVALKTCLTFELSYKIKV